MARDSQPDPAAQRIDALVLRVREGTASDAEREELALYADERDGVAARVEKAERDSELGGQWLARVEADKRLTAAENTPSVTAERSLGMALAVGGVAGSFFIPALAVATVAGLGILTWSVLRVRVRTAAQDPYKDIEK